MTASCRPRVRKQNGGHHGGRLCWVLEAARRATAADSVVYVPNAPPPCCLLALCGWCPHIASNSGRQLCCPQGACWTPRPSLLVLRAHLQSITCDAGLGEYQGVFEDIYNHAMPDFVDSSDALRQQAWRVVPSAEGVYVRPLTRRWRLLRAKLGKTSLP